MNIEYRFAVSAVGKIENNFPVETSGTHERGVEHIRPVGRCHDDDFVIRLEAVHLDKYLIERLFPFIVSASESSAASTADRIYLINENNGRCGIFGHLEKVPYPGSPDADEH